jgi:Flp pilus assembly protein TadG
VELALIVSILGLPLLLGIADMGMLVYSAIEIADAAHAGAMYGITSASAASETSNMIAAAQADAPNFVNGLGASTLTVTPTSYYACSVAEGGTQYTPAEYGSITLAQAAANAACTPSPNHALYFVQVVASAPVTLPFHCCGLPATFTMSSTSVMEVEE